MGDFHGNGIVLHLDWGGGCRNLHMLQKWHRTVHAPCTNVSFPSLSWYLQLLKMSPLEEMGEGL